MITNSEMNSIQSLLVKATPEQMNEIAQAYNDALNLKNAQAARSFIAGDKVKWNGKRGAMSGTVIKVMKKNVRVKVENGDLWNVTATMLSAA